MSRARVRARSASPLQTQARGAALLLALVVVSVVSTVAAAMVWQQWQSVQAEQADRARSQAHWILQGAIDWARLILREDARAGQIDHLGEPWAVPLQEARLSTFLAGGQDLPEDNPALQAFLSGQIDDAQSRFNLRNLALDGNPGLAAARALQRICQAAGVPESTAGLILEGARRSWAPSRRNAPGAADRRVTGESRSGPDAALLTPQRVTELTWWGLEPQAVERLRPWVVILPRATPLNLNTARAEVIAAWIEGIDLSAAQGLVNARARDPLKSIEQALALLQLKAEAVSNASVAVQSAFFEIEGRLRLNDRTFEDRVLVERRQAEVVVLQHDRSPGRARP